MTPSRVFIPSIDARFGYISAAPKHKNFSLLNYSTREKYNQLHSIVPTGPTSERRDILDHSLVVKVIRVDGRHGTYPDCTWKVDFGSGSMYNRGRRVQHDHRNHLHWATLEATLEALKTIKDICKVNRGVTKIVVVTQSQVLYSILGWQKNVHDELVAAGCPHNMKRAYSELQSLISSVETHGRRVQFWYRP